MSKALCSLITWRNLKLVCTTALQSCILLHSLQFFCLFCFENALQLCFAARTNGEGLEQRESKLRQVVHCRLLLRRGAKTQVTSLRCWQSKPSTSGTWFLGGNRMYAWACKSSVDHFDVCTTTSIPAFLLTKRLFSSVQIVSHGVTNEQLLMPDKRPAGKGRIRVSTLFWDFINFFPLFISESVTCFFAVSLVRLNTIVNLGDFSFAENRSETSRNVIGEVHLFRSSCPWHWHDVVFFRRLPLRSLVGATKLRIALLEPVVSIIR